MALLLTLTFLIGLLLGLLGGGGSVLAVPVLVYLQHMEAKIAIATALVMVGATSLTAMVGHARSGKVCWKTGLVFAAAGMLGAYGGGRLAGYVPGNVLLLLFAAVMLATAGAMLGGGKAQGRRRADGICPARIPVPAIVLDGLLVGSITGLVGAGGGFLIVPALNLFAGLPMHMAVGTSLFVLTLNSAAAFSGYMNHVTIDWLTTGAITASAAVGSLLGGLLSRRLSGRGLKRIFGVFVLLVALYILHRELTAELVTEIDTLARAHLDFLSGAAAAIAVALAYRLFAWAHARASKHL